MSFKTRKFFCVCVCGGGPCGNNLETFPLPNDPGRGTISAQLRGTGRTDFHFDPSRLGERRRGNGPPTKSRKEFLRAGVAFSFVPCSAGSWVRPLCSEEKWVPLKRPVPRRLSPSEQNNESPQMGRGGGAAVPRRDNLVSRDTLLKHSVFPDQGQIRLGCRRICRLKAAEQARPGRVPFKCTSST